MRQSPLVVGVTVLTLGILSVVQCIRAAESPDTEPSASELNRQLTNPVSSIWSISNQFNNFELNNGQ